MLCRSTLGRLEGIYHYLIKCRPTIGQPRASIYEVPSSTYTVFFLSQPPSAPLHVTRICPHTQTPYPLIHTIHVHTVPSTSSLDHPLNIIQTFEIDYLNSVGPTPMPRTQHQQDNAAAPAKEGYAGDKKRHGDRRRRRHHPVSFSPGRGRSAHNHRSTPGT
jgi:hypothetical protein